MSDSVTVADFKAAMGSFAAGVTVITTMSADATPFALTATAFSSVSKTPPLCLVCVSHDAEAHPVIRATGLFAVNFLARTQEHLSARFATHGIDKFDGVVWTRGEATGCPVLPGALAALECVVTETMSAGDHDVFLGSIRRIVLGGGEPLLHFRAAYWDLAVR
jgi:flavin reductase (DIM6/NTAB) family NADH-FMN oxidoreductase RutF